jgi:TolA-binding protein
MSTEFYQSLDWAALLAGIVSLVGAIGVLLKQKSEAKKLRSDETNLALTAITDAYEKMLETQLKSVIAPLEKRINDLEEQVSTLRVHLDKYKDLFFKSTKYISNLCLWIHKEVKEDKISTKPKLPEEIKEYL